jgi:hypothetical protein
MATTPFAEWAPDLPPLGATTDHVHNVFPSSKGVYAAVPSLVAAGDAGLTARCQGAATFIGTDGTVATFAGDVSKLYKWDGTTWDDVSQAATTYATPTDGRWTFSQFGDIVIADNGVDDAQQWVIGTSTTFLDLGGSPPIARYSRTIRGFSFRGALASDLTAIQWSSQFDAEEWIIGTNQGDTQTFLTGGRIAGIRGSQFAVIFQEHAVTIGQYVGPDLIFQFDTVSVERGCVAPGSLAEIEQTVFFLDHDGFYRLDNGQVITPIGDAKVDEYFWNNVNRAYIYRISAVIDPRRKLYMVSFPSQDSADGTPDSTMVYNYVSGWWALLDVGGDALSLLVTQQSMTLEGLDAEFPSGLDSITLSLDSDLWIATGIGRMAMFGSDFFVRFFDGTPMDAEVNTVETALNGARQTEIDRIIPMVTGGDDTTVISAKLAYRNRQNDELTFSSEVEQDALGDIWFAEPPARYHHAHVLISGEWDKAQGIEFAPADGGDG